jgi:hypothetical protein
MLECKLVSREGDSVNLTLSGSVGPIHGHSFTAAELVASFVYLMTYGVSQAVNDAAAGEKTDEARAKARATRVAKLKEGYSGGSTRGPRDPVGNAILAQMIGAGLDSKTEGLADACHSKDAKRLATFVKAARLKAKKPALKPEDVAKRVEAILAAAQAKVDAERRIREEAAKSADEILGA